MPVVDLEERFQEVGHIKIGYGGPPKMSKGGKKFRQPGKYGFFMVTGMERGPDENFKPDPIMAKLGKEPKELKVRLLFDRIQDSFDDYYGVFQGGKCLCSGNGDKAVRHESRRDDKGRIILTGKSKEVECGQKCPFFPYLDNGVRAQKYAGGDCKLNGKLMVVLEEALIVGGVYVWRTTGRNSIRAIRSSLAFIQGLTGGVLAGLPLKMVHTKQQATTRDGTRTTIPVVNIVYAGTMEQLREKALEIARVRASSQIEMTQLRKQFQLISMENTPEDEMDISREFYHETADVTVILQDGKEIPAPTATPEELADIMEDSPWNVGSGANADEPPTPQAQAELEGRQQQARDIIQQGGDLIDEETGEILEAGGLDEPTPGDAPEPPPARDESGLSEGEKKLAAEQAARPKRQKATSGLNF